MFFRKVKTGEMSPQVKAAILGIFATACGFLLYDFYQKAASTETFVKFYWSRLATWQVPLYAAPIIGIIVCVIIQEAWSFLREPKAVTPEISEIPGPETTQSVENHQVAPIIPDAQDETPKLMKIDPPTYPNGRDSFPHGRITIIGTYSGNPPSGWRLTLFTRRDNTYWPKGGFRVNHDGTWTCSIVENHEGETQLVAARVRDGVRLWIDLYDYVGKKHKDWVGTKLDPLPESIQVDDVVTIRIGPKSS